MLWLATVGARASPPVAVYRCAGAAGEVLFSDLPCPGGVVASPRPITTIEPARLTSDEAATLERIERGEPAHRAPPAAPVPRQVSEQRERRCDAALDGLDRVHALRRHGYRAARDAELRAREATLARQRDRECSAGDR
jgi:hypothetical protein